MPHHPPCRAPERSKFLPQPRVRSTACERTRVSSFNMVSIVSSLRSRISSRKLLFENRRSSFVPILRLLLNSARTIELGDRYWVGYFLRWFAIAHRTMDYE